MIEEQHIWDGAELSFDFDGENYTVPLTDTEFECVAKVLGFQMDVKKEEIFTYSEETLKKMMNMNGNPLKLRPID